MSTLRMMAKSHLTVLGIAATIIVGLSAINAAAQAPLTTDEAKQIAIDAYIYGYPLVTMEMTRRVLTNVTKPKAHTRQWGS